MSGLQQSPRNLFLTLLTLLVLLISDMSVAAISTPTFGLDGTEDEGGQSNISPVISSSPILVTGLAPLMCGEQICETPSRDFDRAGRAAAETWGWWFAYGPDKDWNGMDDRLQMVLSGEFESESPTAITGPDGRASLALAIDYAWHPTDADLYELRSVLESHGWVGQQGGAWWQPLDLLDTVAVDKVPVSALMDIWSLDGVVVVEMQNVLIPFLDTASPGVLARDSDVYTDEAQERGYRGDGVVIAVLDTGVDNEHRSLNDFDDDNDDPDLDATSYNDQKWVAGYDATSSASRTDGTEDPDDGQGHGSHCAGIALGTGDASRINQGAAPGAYLVDIKVLTDAGGTNSQYSYNGIQWMIQNVDTDWGNNASSEGVQVASMSFGTFSSPLNPDDTGDNGSGAEARLVNDGADAGIAMVIAMGNDGRQRVPSPASADAAISVAAVNNRNTIDREDDTIASYSNSGPREDDGDDDDWDELKPTIASPGSGIMSVSAATGSSFPGSPRPMAEDSYDEKDGTSMSTPLVAGVIALMIQADPDLEHYEIRDTIQNYSELRGTPSATEVNDRWNDEWGYGLIDAACLINAVLSLPCNMATGGNGTTPPPPPSNGTGDVVQVNSPVNDTWFVVGKSQRVSGTLDDSVSNRTWDHLEARVTRGNDVLLDWTRAGGLNDWFIDIIPQEDWVEDGESAWVEIVAVDDEDTPSNSAFASIKPAMHTISFTSPSGHDDLEGTVSIGGTWEGIDATSIELRVDNGEWETTTTLNGGEYGGDTWTSSWDSLSVADGSHRLTVRLVNSSGYHSDEVRRTFMVDNEPPMADLLVHGGVQTLVNGLPEDSAFVQTMVEVHADVVNNGDKDVDDVIVRLTGAGSAVVEHTVPNMRQGEIHSIIFWNWIPVDSGEGQQVTIEIDPGNQYSESEENNNDYVFDFDVLERPDEIALSVRGSGINTNPQIPDVGDSFRVISKVENIGQVGADSVIVTLEEFLPGLGWQLIEEATIPNIPGSTVSTSYAVHEFAVGGSELQVRQFRIEARVDLEIDISDNKATFHVIFDDVQLLGAATELNIQAGETPLGYSAAGDNGHLLTTREGELHLRTVSSSFSMPGDILLEEEFAGQATIFSSGDGSSYVAWTRRVISEDGYTMQDVAFTTVEESGETSAVISLMTPLKVSEGAYWGLTMDSRDELLVLAGFHRDIATGGSYQDVTNLFILSTTTPATPSGWALTSGVVQNIDISQHIGDPPAVAIGEDQVHVLYESMRDDSTGINRVGLFYAHGQLGHAPWSFLAPVGDNASLPNLKVRQYDGEEHLIAVWREGSGQHAELVHTITDSSWSVEEPDRYPAPGMSAITLVDREEDVQVLFDMVGFQGPEIHYGLMAAPDVQGFSAALDTAHFFDAAMVGGDTHFLTWSYAGGFYIRSLVEPGSNGGGDDDEWNFIDRLLEPLPGDREMKVKIGLGLVAGFFLLIFVVSIVIRRGRRQQEKLLESGALKVELGDEKDDVELVEEEVLVAIDLDAEVVEVSLGEADADEDEEGQSLADSLRESAQEDGASTRAKRRLARLEKAEAEKALAELPPPAELLPGLPLPPTPLPAELPPPPAGLAVSPTPDVLPMVAPPPQVPMPGSPLPGMPGLERQAECTDCEIHFTVKDSTLSRIPCPMCAKQLEL